MYSFCPTAHAIHCILTFSSSLHAELIRGFSTAQRDNSAGRLPCSLSCFACRRMEKLLCSHLGGRNTPGHSSYVRSLLAFKLDTDATWSCSLVKCTCHHQAAAERGGCQKGKGLHRQHDRLWTGQQLCVAFLQWLQTNAAAVHISYVVRVSTKMNAGVYPDGFSPFMLARAACPTCAATVCTNKGCRVRLELSPAPLPY